MKKIKNNNKGSMDIIIAIGIIVLVIVMCYVCYVFWSIGEQINETFPDGDSYYVDGYLIDVEYVGGAFGYRARTVFFFNDSRVINVVDREQVSVELNTYVRLELQNSKDGEYIYLINVEVGN